MMLLLPAFAVRLPMQFGLTGIGSGEGRGTSRCRDMKLDGREG